jgi:predicted lipase
VYTAVADLIKLYPQAEVMTIGFSTGGAIALLDALFFSMNGMPNQVKTVNYGMSRVGNQAFAGLVDAYLPENVKRIVNKRDPFPVVPALSLGYSHVAGEVHIQEDGKWTSCYGDDNGDSRCIAGTVTSMQDANFNDHFGPYANVTTLACSG